ncbi:hypothetical protein [Candidatus Laterigemmans baculatus]|uniref:hypothetical protein n=1 Tax=Candidatus Laterigemmans baculatus TaxID=2770505 RepID=UPI0013DA433C|nr:hypothetical protein [Candidatus Laterigemmans baculatus]
MQSADADAGGAEMERSGATQGICWLLVGVGLAMVAARIAVVRSATGEVPFLGANDRSRWATVSALVDDGTYAIDRQLEIRDAGTGRRTWQTIDLVRHRGRDGRQHYYSSKPPLLPTMIAGVYAAVRGATGSTLEERPFFVGRWVLALVNLPMLAVLYGCVVSVILRCRLGVSRCGTGHFGGWGAVFLTAGTVFGTLVTPFAITLNNHLPAAMATAVALWCFVNLHRRGGLERGQSPGTLPRQGGGPEKAVTPSVAKGRQSPEMSPHQGGVSGRAVTPSGATPSGAERGLSSWGTLWESLLGARGLPRAGWGWMFLAGAAAAFAVANELPALSMAAVWSVMALRRDWIRGLTAFAPGALLVAVAFFGTNWLAHATWRPAYAHRTVGAPVASFEATTAASPSSGPRPADVRRALTAFAEGPVTVEPSRTPDRWRAHFRDTDQLWAIERAADVNAGGRSGGATRFVIREWDDWYDYPGSYWTAENLTGVDRGEPSRVVYAFHMLGGHHGVFSLTPLWLLSLVGSVLWLVRGGRTGRATEAAESEEGGEAEPDPLFRRLLAAGIVAVTLVCMAFYVARPLIDRNYGGVSVAFRWLLWLVPLWLWLAIPAVAAMQRSRWGRAVCGVLLIGSTFSVFAALENPWSHPWIYRYLDYLGWIAD